jgi:hypothetical protein
MKPAYRIVFAPKTGTGMFSESAACVLEGGLPPGHRDNNFECSVAPPYSKFLSLSFEYNHAGRIIYSWIIEGYFPDECHQVMVGM